MLKELVDFDFKSSPLCDLKLFNENKNSYCDKEISDVSLQERNPVDNLIIGASKIKWIKYDEDLQLSKNNLDKLITFKTEDNNMILFFISLNCSRWSGIYFYGLIKKDTKEYVFVGIENCHPFIMSNNFDYCDSDGSGPNIECESDDSEELLKQMQHYYEQFLGNRYH